MKKFFLPIFAVLLVLGSILPLAAYRVTRAVLSGAEPASSAVSSPAASAQPPSAVPSADAETFLVEDQATGQVLELSRQEYVLGAVAAEMPVSWPDEALKAQAVAAHSYALYCRDHTTLQSGAWLTADPARRQGCLTEPVLRSYWGTAYEQNYARLSALVDEVLDEILYYENAPACASYFAISNGQTEASLFRRAGAAGPCRPWHFCRPRRAGGLVRPGRADQRRIHKNRHGLRADRFRHDPAPGAGPAQHMLYGTVPEREFQLYHPGLRPRCGPEPVGYKGHGGAGQKLCRYSGTLLPRHAAAAVRSTI